MHAHYFDLEETADEKVVFEGEEETYAQLSLQEKGAIFALASRFLDVLDEFQQKFVREIKQF